MVVAQRADCTIAADRGNARTLHDVRYARLGGTTEKGGHRSTAHHGTQSGCGPPPKNWKAGVSRRMRCRRKDEQGKETRVKETFHFVQE